MEGTALWMKERTRTFNFLTLKEARMPLASSLAATTGYGRMPTTLVITGAPAYYTSNSGFLLNQPGFTVNTVQLKNSTNIGTTTVLRTYTGFLASWTFSHDKDLDSNVIYKMPEGSRILYKYVLSKGGTTATQTTIMNYTGGTTSVLGSCYAPACMWTGTGYGAFVIGGFSQSVIHVLEFNQAKTAITATYTAAFGTGNEVYGTEVIPRQASGFTQHFAIGYTRNGTNARSIASLTVNMDTRTWSNFTVIGTYATGTTGPSNGNGMIYYPPGKAIFTGDPDTSTNRIGLNDTGTARLYVWTVTQSGNRLNVTYLKNVTLGDTSGYPYHLSQAAYNAIV
jgi:hypothetical protein